VRATIISASLLACLAAPALAQSSAFDPVNKWSWQENTGWMNWSPFPDPAGSNGPLVYPMWLGGFVWAENVGWINLGDGSPAVGMAYANLNGTDFGVNILVDGRLAGLAWGENIGWINFGPHATLPPAQQARLSNTNPDLPTTRFLGYAWAENVGWVNLDDASKFVQINRCPCVADFDGSGGTPDVTDIDAFFTGWLAGDDRADADCSGGTPDTEDISVFFNEWLAGGC
jgi:hypothetical protein